ncbi:MAG TPA: M28 family peptidase [Bacteroidota bacterium]|nr:M28 family peptidase [Bacteroidota bacterium]
MVTVWLLAISSLSCGGGESPLLRGSGSISANRVAAHLAYLASDALQGRNTPSPGLDSAATYIARVFAGAGLQSVDGSYFQDILLHTVALGDSNSFELRTPGRIERFALKEDFVPFDMTADRSVTGDLVFAGYGIVAPEYGYDDYAGLDVRGKIVVVLRHEPGEDDSLSVFMGRKNTDHGNVGTKARIAKERGAAALLVMTDPLNHTSLTPRGFAWPSLSRIIPRDALPTTLAVEESTKIPVIHIGERVMRRLFDSVDSLKALQARIDSTMRPHPFAFAGVSGTVRTSTSIKVDRIRNVMGILPGSNPALSKSVVIVGAHYDHVGYKKNSPADKDSIFNGADDNASGTTALLEVASALGGAGTRPARSVLLIAFAGEEKGLFGSRFYTEHPSIPLDRTLAMLHMDMVGRNSPDSLLLIADDRDSMLVAIARQQNPPSDFTLVKTRLDSGGSDHMSFAKHQIPALFFHSGLHADYHKPSDEAALIDVHKVARVAGLVFRTAWHLAESAER